LNPLQSIRSWFANRQSQRSLGYGPTGGYIPAAPVLSGTFVTPETSLGVAAVYSAINVISRDIAVLPRGVFRRLPGGGREIETKGELGDLNEVIGIEPNGDMDAFRWTQSSMGHVLGRGNAYSEIVRKKGFVQSLQILHPVKTVPKRTYQSDMANGGTKGRLYYELDNKKKLAPEDCLHLAGLGFDGIVGYAALTLMRQTVGISIGSEQYAAAFYGNGAKTNGFLKTAKKLSEAAVNNLRKTYNQIHQGSQSAHQIGILEEGMDWVDANVSQEDSQFVETRQFQVKDIARIFSIPPHKIGDYSDFHLASIEEANIDYVSMTLIGWVVMIEMEMNRKLLTREQRQTHQIILDTTALLRGNVAAQMLRAQTLRNTGAWSADDIRIDQGFNPLGPKIGGDKYVVQGQYVPLDQVGKIPSSTPPKPGSVETKQWSPVEDRFYHANGEYQ
jgi:HK97 family phage portal protein